jgi:type IV pilus assembly protein PilE
MRVTLEQYYQDNRDYGSSAAACVLANPTGKHFDYSCKWGADNTNQTFIVTATGKASQGMSGFIYTLDHANAQKTEGLPSASWGVTPATCWVTKKGATC